MAAKHILACVDFSEHSTRALAEVGEYASPGVPVARGMITFGWNARGERVEVEERPNDRDLDGILAKALRPNP